MAKPLRLPRVTEQAVLDGLSLRLITPAETDRWNALVSEHHYLRNAQLVGEQLRYVAEYESQWLVLLGWSAAAWHLKARDAWLHWTAAQRATRRHFLAQNSRCLVLADRLQFPNLASRALGLCCARLAADWRAVHGHPIVAVESFVDRQITYGTTYKASGWTLLGPTAGFGRQAQDFYERHDRPKQLWVRALDPEGTAALAQPTLPPALAPLKRPRRCAAPCRPPNGAACWIACPKSATRATAGAGGSPGPRSWASSRWPSWPACPAPNGRSPTLPDA
ncbi:MAG: DUF4338 domain-containing protein [Verrucomicrobia bacterium]|nr:DUF4338 domain-containing protein [Verrucomicrobiota bacterium]